MEQAFPPLATVPAVAVAEAEEADIQVHGIRDIPADWPPLLGNASLKEEVSWCHANRVMVVEERGSGEVVVHLDRAITPAPSWAALCWLETSIRTYSKYVDVVCKTLNDEEYEQATVKLERIPLDEVRSLLAEML